MEKKSDDSLDVNEVNIEQHENENTIIKEPLPLTSCRSNLNEKYTDDDSLYVKINEKNFTVNDLELMTFNKSENCHQVNNENTFKVSLEAQNKYEHFKTTNFPEIVFDNPFSWSPINDKLRCILILHGPNHGMTAPKPFKNH